MHQAGICKASCRSGRRPAACLGERTLPWPRCVQQQGCPRFGRSSSQAACHTGGGAAAAAAAPPLPAQRASAQRLPDAVRHPSIRSPFRCRPPLALSSRPRLLLCAHCKVCLVQCWQWALAVAAGGSVGWCLRGRDSRWGRSHALPLAHPTRSPLFGDGCASSSSPLLQCVQSRGGPVCKDAGACACLPAAYRLVWSTLAGSAAAAPHLRGVVAVISLLVLCLPAWPPGPLLRRPATASAAQPITATDSHVPVARPAESCGEEALLRVH